jgi:multiple sugar transport system substrate-binding protein
LFARFFEMDLELTRTGAISTPDIRDEITSVENQLIITGGAAMFSGIGGSNQLTAMVNAAGRPLKLASLPYLPGEVSGQFLKPSQYFSVYSQTSHITEAVMWLDFVSNSRDANAILDGERGVPISSDIRDFLEPTMDDTAKEIARYIHSVAQFAHPIGMPEPAAHAELDGILQNIRFDVVSGLSTPMQGAERFRSEATRVFAAQ